MKGAHIFVGCSLLWYEPRFPSEYKKAAPTLHLLPIPHKEQSLADTWSREDEEDEDVVGRWRSERDAGNSIVKSSPSYSRALHPTSWVRAGVLWGT